MDEFLKKITFVKKWRVEKNSETTEIEIDDK